MDKLNQVKMLYIIHALVDMEIELNILDVEEDIDGVGMQLVAITKGWA